MAVTWDIRVLDGVGPLTFGMSAQQVAATLDPIAPLTGRSDDGGGFTREVRGAELPICDYKDGALFMVDTHVGVPNVTFEGLPIYETEPRRLLLMLEERNHGAQTYYGFVVFDTIGINTQAFYDVQNGTFFEPGQGQDDRGLAAYRPSPETQMPGMMPITLWNR